MVAAMDSRTVRFVVLLVFTGVTTIVKADNDTSTDVTTIAATSLQSSGMTSGATSKTQTNNNAAGTTTKPTPTTPAPLNCKKGECNGVGIENCTTVAPQPCQSRENCAVVQTNLNDTYSSFSFSCAADCKSLVKEGKKVACCSKSDCTPDLSKPIQNDNGGVAAVPFNFISFLSLVLMSVLVM